MQLVSATALEMFRDALAPRSPNATLTGQTLSSGSLPTRPLTAPTHPAAAAQRKASLRPAAGTTALPEARHRQQAGAVRHPRPPATSARAGHFDAARRNPYAQRMRLLAHDDAASPPPRHAVDPLAAPSAIRDEPTVGDHTIGLPRAPATSARVGHFDAARRNPYAQRGRLLAPDNAASPAARHVAGPLATPSAIRDEPTVGNQISGLPHAPATSAPVGHVDTARRNPYAQRPSPLAPDDTGTAPPRSVSGPRGPSAIRNPPTVGNRTIELVRARATRAQAGHLDRARRNPYAQRTRPLAPDDAGIVPPRSVSGPRATPSAIRNPPTVGNQTIDLPGARATRAQVGHFDPARRYPYAQRTDSARSGTCTQSPGTFPSGTFPPGDTAAVSSRPGVRQIGPARRFWTTTRRRRIGAARGTAVPDGQPNRLIIGISGASGVIYGIRLLQVLRNTPVETHLVISRAAEIALAHETSRKVAEVKAMANVAYAPADIGAAISSGSYRTNGMIVAPCSIRSMSEIATGVTSTLLTRAADVVLKERRRLVLMVRETPLHTGHLRTMLALSEMGAIVAPPVPAFYAGAQSLDDMVDQTIGRVLDLFGIETGLVRRWRED